MNTALQRRIEKLEKLQKDDLTIRVEYGEVPFPEVVVRFVTAKPDPEEPQQSHPYPRSCLAVDPLVG